MTRAAPRNPKPTVEWDGRVYKLRSAKTVVPDLKAMPRFAALQWLISNTYPTGTNHRRPSPLAGFGGAIKVGTR